MLAAMPSYAKTILYGSVLPIRHHVPFKIRGLRCLYESGMKGIEAQLFNASSNVSLFRCDLISATAMVPSSGAMCRFPLDIRNLGVLPLVTITSIWAEALPLRSKIYPPRGFAPKVILGNVKDIASVDMLLVPCITTP